MNHEDEFTEMIMVKLPPEVLADVIGEKITHGDIPNHEEALSVYRYPYDNDDYISIEALIKEVLGGDKFENFELYAGKSSITRMLVNEATPIISNWQRDERSVRILGEDTDNAEDEELEKYLRYEVNSDIIKRFNRQKLLFGVGVICCGLDDKPWTPQIDDITLDWQNDDFIAIRRDLPRTLLKQLKESGDWQIHDGNSNQFEAWEYDGSETTDLRNMVDVWHGNIENGGTWTEFIYFEDSLMYRENFKNIFWNYYIRDPNTGAPSGIYEQVKGHDNLRIQKERAITTIIRKAETASLLIPKGLIPGDAKHKLRREAFLEVDIDKLSGDEGIRLADQMSHVPTQLQLLEPLFLEIDRIVENARETLGLYRLLPAARPMNSDKSATEALIEYEQSHQPVRDMVDENSHVMGQILSYLASYRSDTRYKYEVLENPVDARLKITGVMTLLPQMTELMKLDEDGTKLGGTISGRTINELLGYALIHYKLPASVLETPNPEAIMNNQKKAMEREQANIEAANKAVEIEQMKAQAQMIVAKAEETKSLNDVNKRLDDYAIEKLKAFIEMLDTIKTKADEGAAYEIDPSVIGEVKTVIESMTKKGDNNGRI